MLKKEIEKALNEQISIEGSASFLYLSLASWCDTKGFEGSAAFLYQQSDEERMHMLRLFHYIKNSGGFAVAPEIKKQNLKINNLADVFRLVYKSETKVTESVNDMVDLCSRQKDFSTLNFIQWYVSEQYEEEVLMKSIIDKIELVGDDGKGLFMIDQYIKTIRKQPAANPAAAEGDA
jgi:ferritin